MKPMLAGEADLAKLKFPVVASPKLDGIRGIVVDGVLLSRSLKLIPNVFIQANLAHRDLNGFDGELIIGSPTAKDVYRQTTSVVMSDNKPSNNITFRVFDDMSEPTAPYTLRRKNLERRLAKLNGKFPSIVLHHNEFIANIDDLNDYEQDMLDEGYEGLIVRDPGSAYKFGRSSTREGIMLKIKRFVDGEAEIIGVEEQMHNTNEAQTNELGRTKRSSAKAGLVGKGTMGAIVVRDVNSKVEFSIGTGFDDAEKRWFWDNQRGVLGAVVKYKSFMIGVKDAPRHPVYLGLRDRRDM